MNEPIEVNHDDIESGMWNATWDVCFDSTWVGASIYRAAADCESDALDEVIDWLEVHDKEMLRGLVIDPDTFEGMSEKDAENISFSGNHGYPLQTGLDISITLVKKHRYSYGYY